MGRGIGTGTVTCYCLNLFIMRQPFFKSRTVSSVQYCNRCMSRFIYDNGSVSMSFLKAKSSTPITLPHFAASWMVYRFVSRRITVSPLTLRFIALQIREHPSQLVSIANVQIKSAAPFSHPAIIAQETVNCFGKSSNFTIRDCHIDIRKRLPKAMWFSQGLEDLEFFFHRFHADGLKWLHIWDIYTP